VCSHVRTVCPIDDSDIGTPSTDKREKRVRLFLNRLDNLLTGPMPRRTAKVSDTLMRVVSRLLVDAGHLNVCHDVSSKLELRGGMSAANATAGREVTPLSSPTADAILCEICS
jgi:hypothetical protein